jgi:hypothetical protein
LVSMKRLPARTCVLAVSALLAAALAASCHWDSPSEPDSRDSLTVSSVDPPGGTRLTPGAAVTFTVQVDFDLRSGSVLSGDDGTLILTVEDQDGRRLDTEVRKRVSHGRGSTSLSDRLTVPATGVSQARVVVRLVPDAIDASTLISTAATYPVGS